MTFEEWWEVQEELDRNPANEAFARPVWDAAWDQQQRIIDEMHLAFRGRVLVPVEPTEWMVDEGEIAYVHGGTIEGVYKAMIQAVQEEE